MSSRGGPRWGFLPELGRFLEIQNLGLNLPFALGFLVVASHGLPSVRVLILVLIAFVAARNAGHSFNRWADRDLDARNPRTQSRALVTGRLSPRFALATAAAMAGVVVVAAYLLNPLAFYLSPVAMALVLSYSYTKRVTSWTTAYLGLVEAVTPAAVFIAVVGALPTAAWLAIGAMLLWGTAFETIHSLGDLETDRREGLHSLPLRIGRRPATALVPVFHLVSIGLFASLGVIEGFSRPYFDALGLMAGGALAVDSYVARGNGDARIPFRAHFVLGAIFLAGCLWTVFVPGGLRL